MDKVHSTRNPRIFRLHHDISTTLRLNRTAGWLFARVSEHCATAVVLPGLLAHHHGITDLTPNSRLRLEIVSDFLHNFDLLADVNDLISGTNGCSCQRLIMSSRRYKNSICQVRHPTNLSFSIANVALPDYRPRMEQFQKVSKILLASKRFADCVSLQTLGDQESSSCPATETKSWICLLSVRLRCQRSRTFD